MELIKTVPFNSIWVTSDKLDIRAVYRRPRLDQFKQRVVVDGVPQWDYPSGLPIRRHNNWLAKGYEYVTLSTMQDLADASKTIENPHQYDASYESFGEFDRRPFRIQAYLAQRTVADDGVRDDLKAMVEAYGSAAVENIKRIENPAFVLPEALRGITARGETTPAKPAAKDKPKGTTKKNAPKGETPSGAPA